MRRPLSITIGADGARAAEYGAWTAINKAPKRVLSGTYLESWRKKGGSWKIGYEVYTSLNLAPQSVADAIHPRASIALGGTPDWLVVTPDSVWVSNSALKAVQRIDVRSDKFFASVRTPGDPCSGLTFGFGSV